MKQLAVGLAALALIAAAAAQSACTPPRDCSGVTAAMVAGTVAVNAGCMARSRPLPLTEAGQGGTQGILSYSEIVITSSSKADTSTVAGVQN